MEPAVRLRHKLGQLRRRLRWLVVTRWLALALTGATLAACGLALAAQLRWAPAAVDWIPFVLLLGILGGIVLGFTRTLSLLTTAQLADRRLDLKERLSSALLLSHEPSSPFVAAQQADAAACAAGVAPGQVFPWRAPREARWLLATVALLLATLYGPELPLFQSPAARAERAALAETGRDYRQAAEELERRRSEEQSDAAVLREVARNLKQLGRDQERGRVTRKEALLRAHELRQAIREAERQLGGRDREAMARRARELRQAAREKALRGHERSARALEGMSEALERGDLEAAAQQLEALGERLKQAAREGKASAGELRETAETLEQMADALAGANADEAAKELEKAAEELSAAAEEVARLQEQAANAASPEERAAAQADAEERAAAALQQAGGT